mmetsp:Transcript_4118/g.25965  ORF Transcript_4118/g.25965 Transcript_4118/m.25965 type:complete len:273 (+) Transcript_4118:3420-4238(+)
MTEITMLGMLETGAGLTGNATASREEQSQYHMYLVLRKLLRPASCSCNSQLCGEIPCVGNSPAKCAQVRQRRHPMPLPKLLSHCLEPILLLFHSHPFFVLHLVLLKHDFCRLGFEYDNVQHGTCQAEGERVGRLRPRTARRPDHRCEHDDKHTCGQSEVLGKEFGLELPERLPGKIFEHGDSGNEGGPHHGSQPNGKCRQVDHRSCLGLDDSSFWPPRPCADASQCGQSYRRAVDEWTEFHHGRPFLLLDDGSRHLLLRCVPSHLRTDPSTD